MRKKGFTLIELMVVVAIIAILATVVLVSLRLARSLAEDSNRITAVTQLRNYIYTGFSGENVDFDDYTTYPEGVQRIICEYGGVDNTEDHWKGCSAKGVFNIFANVADKQFCATILLNEKDSGGGDIYYCVDRTLTGIKYKETEHFCSNTNASCTDLN